MKWAVKGRNSGKEDAFRRNKMFWKEVTSIRKSDKGNMYLFIKNMNWGTSGRKRWEHFHTVLNLRGDREAYSSFLREGVKSERRKVNNNNEEEVLKPLKKLNVKVWCVGWGICWVSVKERRDCFHLVNVPVHKKKRGRYGCTTIEE